MSIKELSNTGKNETGVGIANSSEINSSIISNDEERSTVKLDLSNITIPDELHSSTDNILSDDIQESTVSIDLSTNQLNQEVKKVEVDLSTLSQEKVERPGITVQKNFEEEIFSGDDFSNLLRAKNAEREELNNRIDQYNEEVAMMLGEEVPEEITDEVIKHSIDKSIAMSTVEISENESITDDIIDDDELDIEAAISSNIEVVKSTVSYIDNSVYEDLDDAIIEDEDENSEENEEIFKAFQSSISEKITPVSKRLNLTGFTIANKPVNVNTALNNIVKKSAEWLLFSSEAHISMSEFGGIEIQDMADIKSGVSDYTSQLKLFKIILDHIVGDNKPATPESFAKSISIFDYDHIFMAMFIANFAGSNYLPYDCPSCKNAFITDDISIKDMYKFKKEEHRAKFEEILGKGLNEISDLYKSEITPISDRFAIGFKNPSIYDILVEPLLLDKDFTNKYRNVITILTHIDTIYKIDMENKSLLPIDFSKTPSNIAKTLKSKIVTYSKILKSLSPDESGVIRAYIMDIDKDTSPITYYLPEVVCPKCGEVIKAQEVTAENLFFMRHQLTALGSITRN